MVMGNKANKQSKAAAAEGARCRRHSRHRQAGAGVCALCLQERLARLSVSASLPSVVRGGEEDEEEIRASSSCSEASTAYSSEESSVCSSGRASPGPSHFHDEMRRSGRVSLLMRHERVVGDADAVAAFLQARREQRKNAATSFWAKLLNATIRTGGANKTRRQDDACSMAHTKTTTTLQERVAAAKWVLF